MSNLSNESISSVYQQASEYLDKCRSPISGDLDYKGGKIQTGLDAKPEIERLMRNFGEAMAEIPQDQISPATITRAMREAYSHNLYKAAKRREEARIHSTNFCQAA